jgi:flagellar L-ring protein precursor FlgH
MIGFQTRAALLLAVWSCAAAAPKKQPPVAPIDQYVRDAAASVEKAQGASPGSLWTSSSLYADLARDPKATQVNDLVTIRVVENASAVSTGSAKTQRKTSASSSIGALAGPTNALGKLANLANLGSDVEMAGDGATSRQTTLTTIVTARVVSVLPNGYLVLEGAKEVQVNSERQVVTVRGVARPADLAPDNSVASTRLAQMEVRLNGKGVVGDSIRRPFSLYRLLLGLLPF